MDQNYSAKLTASAQDIAVQHPSLQSLVERTHTPVDKNCSVPGLPVNSMTVDVEDYYQVSAFDEYIAKSDWESYPSRVERNVDRLITLFDEADVRGTFFILGWIAERHPGMVKRIMDSGHEIASHGWQHYRVNQQTQLQFREDIIRAKGVLEDTVGTEVKGYRAPSYSVDLTTPWAHDELFNSGHTYSSSVVPIKHDHYGVPEAPRFAFEVKPSGILEVPVSTVKLGNSNKPCGGGGWFRLYPYLLTRTALQWINKREKQACVFYIHPWEIDPDQPRQTGLSAKTRFRHYVNLHSVESKLTSLLEDFNWGRMDENYLSLNDSTFDSQQSNFVI